MLLKIDSVKTGAYTCEHPPYILIQYKGKEYRRKLYDKVLHNDWRFTFRLHNKRFYVPWGLSTEWGLIDDNNLQEVEQCNA